MISASNNVSKVVHSKIHIYILYALRSYTANSNCIHFFCLFYSSKKSKCRKSNTTTSTTSSSAAIDEKEKGYTVLTSYIF